MKVDTISVKYLNKKDIKSDETYVVGLKKIKKSRGETVKAYVGNVPYAYYKTKGYYGMLTLLFDNAMRPKNSYLDSYPIILKGKVILKAWDNIKDPFVVVSQEDFEAYSDFLYNKKDRDEVQKKYLDEWDWTCHNRQPEKIFAGEDGAFRLPGNIARSLKSDKDWAMAKRARASWQILEENGILDNAIVHNKA